MTQCDALHPDQITIQDCRTYRDFRLAQGRAIGTVHTELGHLRCALNWAAKCELIGASPYIDMPPKPDSDVRPLSRTEISELIKACHVPHIRLAVILLLATGARIGAVLDLQWNRVDFDRNVIDLRLPDGVTRKGRAVVPINRMARTALDEAFEGRLSDHVIEWCGRPIRSIRTGYQAALTRAGMTDVNIHQIRHTIAVQMLQGGRPIAEVSQYLGHSNVQITSKIYARFQPDFMLEAAEILNFD